MTVKFAILLKASLAIARPSTIVDFMLVWEKLSSFSSAQEACSTGLVQMTLYAIGCLPSLSCRHCVKPANSAPGGKACLVIGSRKNVS